MVLVLRKLYRLSGLCFVFIYFFTDKRSTIFWLTGVTGLFLLLEIARSLFPRFNRKLFKRFRNILKEEESDSKVLGTTYFLVGSLLTVIFFSRPIAVASLVYLIFGDGCSALVGVKWGKSRIGRKTLEGSLAFLASCLLMAIVLHYTFLELDLRIALWGAFAATLTELIPLPVNDNLSIPLCSAWVMTVL